MIRSTKVLNVLKQSHFLELRRITDTHKSIAFFTDTLIAQDDLTVMLGHIDIRRQDMTLTVMLGHIDIRRQDMTLTVGYRMPTEKQYIAFTNMCSRLSDSHGDKLNIRFLTSLDNCTGYSLPGFDATVVICQEMYALSPKVAQAHYRRDITNRNTESLSCTLTYGDIHA